MFDYKIANQEILEYKNTINNLHFKASKLKNLYGLNYKNNPLYNHKLWVIHHSINKYQNLIKNIEYIRYLEQKQDKIFKKQIHPIISMLLLDTQIYSLPPDIINIIVKNITI
jgi:hypothetical protein